MESLAILKREETTLKLVKQGNSISVASCVNNQVIKFHPLKEDYKLLIGKALSKCFYLHGKQFNPEMIEIFTDELINTYEYESPQTILLFLKKAAAGNFGKFFGQPDIGTIREWFADFLRDTIVPERERQNTTKEKHDSNRGQERSLKEYLSGSRKTGPVLFPHIGKRKT